MLYPLRPVLWLAATICLLVGGPILGWCQLPVFRNYNTEDGLPSSETYCIEQDSRGYIYIGTDRGLARFDGRRFETFTTKDGLVNNTVFSVLAHEDKVWYFTFSSMIGYLKQDTAHAYLHNQTVKHLMYTGLLSHILPGDRGSLYLNKGTYERATELIRINADGSTDHSLSTPINSDHIDVYLTPYRRLLRTGYEKAREVNLYTWPDKKLIHTFVAQCKDPYTVSIICGYQKDTTIWLLFRDVYLLRGKTQHKIISASQYHAQQPLFMLVDKQENIWLGYHNQGLMLFRKANNYKHPVRLLRNHSISGMLEDREGGLWFTTHENGVYYLPPDFLQAYDQRTGLSSAKVTHINTYKHDIAVQQSDFSFSLTTAMKDSWQSARIGKNINYALFGREGFIYYLSTSGKVLRGKRYIHLPSSRIYSSGRHVWGTWVDSLSRYDDKGHKKYDLPVAVPYFVSLYESENEHLLLGSLEGLFLYAEGKLHRLTLTPSVYKERMSDIKELDKEHLLVATSGKGILVIDKKSYCIVRQIMAADGLKNMICNVVRCDDSGVVWAGTNGGLYRIEHILDKSRTRVQWADIHNGINSNEINDICIIEQNLWLATAKGISIFPRNKNLSFTDSIPVRIQNLKVNGKARNTMLSLNLDHDQNNISISFIGLNYQYADVLQYRYRLLGNGKEIWSYTHDPSVNYNALPPGDYIFEYGAMAPNQSGKIYTATFSFSIAPPFWQRWWFIFIVVVVVLSCISLFIRYRIRSIQRQVKLKTDLSIYRDKALRDQMSPHFIYNALNTIQNYILKHDTDMSVSFLSKFSRLMRLIFNNTVQEVITIQKDLEALLLYTEMERMRFPGKLNFHLPQKLPDSLKQALVPPLLLQPFVENAVLHGLLPKNAPGNVWLTIEQVEDGIRIDIKDDGIGRAAAAKIKSKKRAFLNRDELRPSRRKHSGTTITIARIAQAWEKLPAQSRFKITDLYHPDGSPAGTFIQFYLPLNYDKSDNS